MACGKAVISYYPHYTYEETEAQVVKQESVNGVQWERGNVDSLSKEGGDGQECY